MITERCHTAGSQFDAARRRPGQGHGHQPDLDRPATWCAHPWANGRAAGRVA